MKKFLNGCSFFAVFHMREWVPATESTDQKNENKSPEQCHGNYLSWKSEHFASKVLWGKLSQYSITRSLTLIGSCGSPNYDVKHCINFRRQILFMSDIHAIKYVAVRAAVLQIRSIKNSFIYWKYNISQNKLYLTTFALIFNWNFSFFQRDHTTGHHTVTVCHCFRDEKTPTPIETGSILSHPMRMSPHIVS